MNTFVRRWGPALLVMVTIFAFSATRGNDLPSFGLTDLLVKKGDHMLGYAVLGLASLRGFSGTKGRRAYMEKGIQYRWLWAFGLAVAYALTDEFHQVFTPGRHAALTDVAIDAAGAALGLFAAWSSGRLRGWLTWNL